METQIVQSEGVGCSYTISERHTVTRGEITGATAILQILNWKVGPNFFGWARDSLLAGVGKTDGAGGDSGGEALGGYA